MSAIAPEPDAAGVGAPEGEWQAFSPLTPWLRGGVMALAVVGWVVSQQVDRFFGAERGDPTEGHLWQAGLAVLVVILGAVAMAWVSWRAARFRLGPTSVELKQGVLTRQHRQVRYDRIQAVDVNRPLLARLAGLSAVRIEAAGGVGSSVELAYLPQDRAIQVRDLVLGRANSAAVAAGGEPAAYPGGLRTPGADGGASGAGAEGIPVGESAARAGADTAYRPAGEVSRLIAAIPAPRVWAATALSGSALILVAGAPLVVVALVGGWVGVLPVLGPAVLGAGSSLFGRLTGWMNFRVEDANTAIRVRRGLTELRTTTVPVHRIQAVEVHQPAFWRRLDWWRISVNVAGVNQDPLKEGASLIPVGTRAEVLSILTAMGPGWALPQLLVGLNAPAAAPGFRGAPAAARWLDPFSWRRIGVALTETAVITRGGWLGRTAQLVPYARIQSITLTQGPVERRLDLATVRLRSTVGEVDPQVRHLSTADAHDLVAQVAARARAARVSENGVSRAGVTTGPSAEGGGFAPKTAVVGERALSSGGNDSPGHDGRHGS